MDTKEKILDAALTLFSRKGYEGVSVGEIAQAVGIKAPSLYKHYGSKQEIFDAIVQTMDRRYQNQAAAMALDGENPRKDGETFGGYSTEHLEETVFGLFTYVLQDPWTARFRRMLVLEQFRLPALGALFTKLYVEQPLAYQKAIFERLMEIGLFRRSDPQALALEFYSPIYLLLTLCDREPERMPWALETLKTHITVFTENHREENTL